jgi:hypothetical protein
LAEILKVYTEEELRRVKVGKYVDSHDYGFEEKKHCYRDQGVWPLFSQLRAFYRKKCTDETGYVFHDIATHVAQVQIDTYLILRARGKLIAEPIVPSDSLIAAAVDNGTAAGDELFDLSEFGGQGEIDPITMMTWVFNNMSVKGVTPKDAPSPGAYAYLRFIQKNQDNMVDFYTKAFPRLIPAKSQMENSDKFNDDNRATFDLLGRLSGEGDDGSGEIPVL